MPLLCPLCTTPLILQAPWIYFIETDYLLVKPVHAPGPAESAVPALGFRFPNIAYGAPRTQVNTCCCCCCSAWWRLQCQHLFHT